MEAGRRATACVRRYVVSHRLTRQITLTYAPEHLPESLDEAWRHVEDFRRRLGSKVGPMVVVPEWGKESGRFHLHALVNRYVPKWVVEKAWRRRGWVDIRMIKASRSDGPPGRRQNARIAARYASKYLSKTFGPDGQVGSSTTEGRRFGGKRYSTTKGTKVEPRRLRFRTRAEAMGWAVSELAGGWAGVTGSWSSDEVEGWEGPPVWLIYWDETHGP